MGVRVATGVGDDAPVLAQLQIEAALDAYGTIVPASARPPLFDEEDMVDGVDRPASHDSSTVS